MFKLNERVAEPLNIFDQVIPSHACQGILLHWVVRCSQSKFIKIGYLRAYVKYI